MNEEWGFYVPIDEEYFNTEMIERYDEELDIHIIRTQSTFFESVCGLWKLICFIVFRSR